MMSKCMRRGAKTKVEEPGAGQLCNRATHCLAARAQAASDVGRGAATGAVDRAERRGSSKFYYECCTPIATPWPLRRGREERLRGGVT